jgi:alkylation response protein AidB-like acyl-CoA dehydrogenase
VDFRITEDQEALREGLRDFLEGRYPTDALGELAGEERISRERWTELAEMGVFSLRLPEDEGGLGLGNADAVLIFEELGRRAVPGPLVWSHLAAGLVPEAASGDAIVGGLDRMHGVGEPVVVEHLESLDVLLVLRPEGVFRIDPRGLEAQRVATPTDPLTPVHHARALPAGERIAGPEGAERLRLEGAAFASALCLGMAETCVELATDYTKKREQFGRPIGSFQAVKHILADMFVRQEQARAAVYAAGATLDDPTVGDVLRAVGSAKLVCEAAAHKNARACIQVHGGMGFTWEMPPHYYLKRTWVLETCFGDAEAWALKLAERIGAAA